MAGHEVKVTLDNGTEYVQELDGGNDVLRDQLIAMGTQGFFASAHAYYPAHRIRHIEAFDLPEPPA